MSCISKYACFICGHVIAQFSLLSVVIDLFAHELSQKLIVVEYLFCLMCYYASQFELQRCLLDMIFICFSIAGFCFRCGRLNHQ